MSEITSEISVKLRLAVKKKISNLKVTEFFLINKIAHFELKLFSSPLEYLFTFLPCCYEFIVFVFKFLNHLLHFYGN